MRLVPFFLAAASWAHPSGSRDIALPTPRDHYESYDWESEARSLFLELAASLPEAMRARALDEKEWPALVGAIDWRAFRPRLERILLHGSRVLDVVPESQSEWIPLVHDALLLFLHRLDDERFQERLEAQARLPRDASRGERILAFAVNAPSLQKLAQILARNPALAPDLRLSLQTFENGLSSVRYDEIMEVIHREMTPDLVAEHGISFRDHLLAEASVGAVVEATYRASGNEARAACKVLKPRAVAALEEDLGILDEILSYLERNAEFYEIGDAPLVDIFEEIREALSREIEVSDERRNLVRAREYYRDSPRILVPEVLAFSTENVTCMEFVEGVKVTDAFRGSPKERARLARRLSDALTFDVLLSRKDPALFHGDPHAGNVFSVADGSDPYRLALLDWGLLAEFTIEEREMLIQLMLGLYLRDAKRLGNNVGALVDFHPKDEAEKRRMRERVTEMVSSSRGDEMFPLLDRLITGLAKEGYRVRYEAAIFIKSQLTIAGILQELDPKFDQDDHLMGRIEAQVYRELPRRFLRTVWFPAWNSHDYRSLLSNEDVKDIQLRRTGRFFAKVGKGIWTGVSFRWLF